MLLCIDIGNTNLVFGVWHGGTWQARYRVRTVQDKMEDEYAMLLNNLLKDSGLSLSKVDRAVISSVVPELRPVFRKLFKKYCDISPLVLGPGVKTGLSINIDNPSELGADLVADAVAARERCTGACIVVDFGTATTFSGISEKGEYMGVAIAPGIEVAAKALSLRAAQLPRISLVPPPSALGKNTISSMQAGLIFGYIGLVENLIATIKEELGGRATVIATGGSSSVIAPHASSIDIIDPHLTLEGLRIINDKNT